MFQLRDNTTVVKAVILVSAILAQAERPRGHSIQWVFFPMDGMALGYLLKEYYKGLSSSQLELAQNVQAKHSHLHVNIFLSTEFDAGLLLGEYLGKHFQFGNYGHSDSW